MRVAFEPGMKHRRLGTASRTCSCAIVELAAARTRVVRIALHPHWARRNCYSATRARDEGEGALARAHRGYRRSNPCNRSGCFNRRPPPSPTQQLKPAPRDQRRWRLGHRCCIQVRYSRRSRMTCSNPEFFIQHNGFPAPAV